MHTNQTTQLKIEPTGLEGLDAILGGGIPLGSLIMLIGEPGTGKTTLLQQLCFTWDVKKDRISLTTGAPSATDTRTAASTAATTPELSDKNRTRAEVEAKTSQLPSGVISPLPSKALYFSTLSEPHDKVIEHMRLYTFFDQAKLNTQVRFFSLTGIMERDTDKNKDKENSQEVGNFIVTTTRKEKASLVVIDGLGALFESFNNLQDARYFLNQLSAQLGTLGVTTILSLEQSFLNSNNNSLLTGVDGIIGLSTSHVGAGEYHRLQVHKLRGMKRLEGVHSYKFNNNGLVFYPRLETLFDHASRSDRELETLLEDPAPLNEDKPRLAFGLPELEKMLNGGLPSDSSTFVAGSPGAGKTLLSLHYLMEGIARGEAGLFVGFYEGPGNIIKKADRFNLDLRSAIKARQLKLLIFPSVELEPDQVAYRIKQAVEEYGIKRVVIDGVLELEIACRPDGRSRNYTSALDSYFKEQGIAALYTYTISKLIGPELDLSDTVFTVLAENLILLRQLAYQARLYRIVSVLKMRDSIYDLSIREFTIENEVGIRVLQPFQSGEALLNGLAYDLSDLPPDINNEGKG